MKNAVDILGKDHPNTQKIIQNGILPIPMDSNVTRSSVKKVAKEVKGWALAQSINCRPGRLD